MPEMELSCGLLETYMARFELTRDQVLEQKAAFNMLDIDGSGQISYQELKAVNAKYDGGFTEQELEEQFKELDVGSSGHISFQEFLKVHVKGEFGRDVVLPKVREETENVLEHAETGLRTPRRPTTHLESIKDEEEEIRPPSTRVAGLDTPPAMEMRISSKNTIGFYWRAAVLFLRGAEGKEPVDNLRISALGGAINAAVTVAARVQQEGLGSLSKVQTAYPEMADGRGCAQIAIDVIRTQKL